MAEILKEWLTERLQRPIKWDAREFGDLMKNGHIVASVLYSYHIINEEKLYLIRPSNIFIDIKSNWKYLSEWLRSVDVYLTDAELNNIMEGKGSALLRLFYQLFLHLDKRDRTDFLKRERKMVSALVEKLENRFIVEAIKEEKEPVVDYLSRPLLNEKHFIEWQQKKAAEVKEHYEYVRHKYKKMIHKIEEAKIPCWQAKPEKVQTLTSSEKSAMEKFALKHPCKFKNYTYEQLLSLEESNSIKRKSLSDTDWASNFMDDLHKRIHLKSDSEKFQTQIRNILSNSLWDASLDDEESGVDIDLAKKVMKLSQYEKQMCTQIMETKQQARNLAKNRADAEREYALQRDQQFTQYLNHLQEQIHLELSEIDFEKHRQDKLHKTLYEEKMRRKKQHHYEICYETMLSIVDYAIKLAYWTRLLGNEIPDHFIHEWQTLFFKKQPIFDILDPMEDLLKEHAVEEEPAPEEEEIIRLELDRQEELNDNEFLEYHNYMYPWALDLLIPNYDNESAERKYEYLGTRILGHVVFTLLGIKYPPPPPRPPADLPQFTSKALVRNLPDKSITVPMQILLNHSNIHVVRVESAVNFVLRQFKTEMIGCSDIDISYDKFSVAAQDENRKEFVRSLKTEDEMRTKNSDGNIAAYLGVIPPNFKLTQTPKTLPEEDLILSPAADLGRYVYEALSFGDSLTDHLIAAILVEYIKDQGKINGFVIINYPNCYREAQILEETFSGQEPPNEAELLEDSDDIYLEETISKHRKKEKDPFIDMRVSKIVSNPHKNIKEKPFESYFTCYLRLKETDDILQEYVIWDLTEENSELIDRFYAVLGLNFSLYYEVIEKDLLSQICKYIIGDLNMPLKTSETLFGENILNQLEFTQSDDKRTKSKMVKPDVSVSRSKDKLRRLTSQTTPPNNDIDLNQPSDSQFGIMDNTLMEENIGEEIMASSTVSDVVAKPGEEDWDYGDLQIPEIIGLALATCWEEIEKTYVHDMKQQFFSKRLQMNSLIPYCSFIKDKMEQIITLPSFKQDIVSRFQREYNNFEDDWRCINLSKNEWHCRIKELKTKLCHICDERKIFAEQQRYNLIADSWTANELTTMLNTYISCMQAELNRSVLTFQTLHDFYNCMLKKMPPSETLYSRDLTKLFRDTDDTGLKKNSEDKQYKHVKAAFQDMHLKNINLNINNNPMNMILDNNVKFAMKVIKDINDHYRSLISREYTEVAKLSPSIKKKEEPTASTETVNVEDLFKHNALKCVDEWLVGVNGEMFRLNLRLQMLHQKCLQDMKLFNDTVHRAFVEIQNDINTHYKNEIKSVDRLCKYLQMAVENGVKIPETLLLEHDQFIIDPNLLQFETAVTRVESDILKERVDVLLEFKICQLARLRSQFKIVAPTGIALQQAFIYLLQDFIFFGKESCEGPLFPELFKRVDPEQVTKLVFLIFGETAYVDWRDFLIYCLNIRYPTVDELLEARHKFRCHDKKCRELIHREDFIDIDLWYESDFEMDDPYAQLRKTLIKHFLFELFETSKDQMNYSAFLLAFCKNINPIEGFTTALAMSIGRKICYEFHECGDVVCRLIKLKKTRDEDLALTYQTVNEFLEEIITNVVNMNETTYIEDLPYEKLVTEGEAKGKKGKRAPKKVDSSIQGSQSARSPKKIDKNILGKQVRSDSDVKQQVYICGPCEPVPEQTDKSTKDEIEEEHRSEALPDPELVYTVSQDVIWKVLRICLPWQFALVPDRKRTPYEDQVKEVVKRLEPFTDEGNIYVSMFVIDPVICKMLHKVKKFTTLNIVDEVRKVCL
ncbi:hypothetical protein O0L34_g304 [Tuta absoluta]|nr:hypothetical protein O0L34_g304 [Tuta absoluta]